MVRSPTKVSDAESLVDLHERFLFLCAYPPNQKTLKQAEKDLKRIATRVEQLREADKDLSPLDTPEVSGIAGMNVTSNFSYALVRWCAPVPPRHCQPKPILPRVFFSEQF